MGTSKKRNVPFFVALVLASGAGVAQGDVASSIAAAERLLDSGQLAEAAELLRPVVAEAALRRRDPELHERALVGLGQAIDREARRAEQAASALLDAGDPRRAAAAYEEAATMRYGSPYLTLDCLAPFGAESESAPHLHAFLHRVEATLYNEALGRAAFAWWLAGDDRALANVLERPISRPAVIEPDAVDDLRVRRLAYSSRLAELGALLFRQGTFDPAARAYATAMTERLRALGGTPDDEWGRQQLNCALAEYNAQRPARAAELLAELQRRLPAYRPEQVAKELADALRASAPR